MTTVEVAGCVFGLPSDQFTHDINPERLNRVLYHSRYKLTFFGAGAEPELLDGIKDIVKYTNLYEFVRAVYNATERDISTQPDMDALVRHSMLLKAKDVMVPYVFEDSCIEFTRGDVNGFIIGDPGRSEHLYIYLYVPSQEQFIHLGIRKKASLEMPDIVSLISLIKVEPNPQGGANSRRSTDR